MRDQISVPREQLIKRLRQAGFKHKRKTKRVEIYKRPGNTTRIDVAIRDKLPESYVRAVLGQAGCSANEIDQFLRECIPG